MSFFPIPIPGPLGGPSTDQGAARLPGEGPDSHHSPFPVSTITLKPSRGLYQGELDGVFWSAI